jgi:hypothetical protein
MQKKVTQNKDKCTVWPHDFRGNVPSVVKKPKLLKELLRTGGKRLSDLKTRAEARARVFDLVCAALPPPLAKAIVSAGLEHDQLTIGVDGAAWAARLRYLTEILRAQVGSAMGVDIQKVRVKVVPPKPLTPRTPPA